jgi:hypothetical protein
MTARAGMPKSLASSFGRSMQDHMDTPSDLVSIYQARLERTQSLPPIVQAPPVRRVGRGTRAHRRSLRSSASQPQRRDLRASSRRWQVAAALLILIVMATTLAGGALV